MRFVVILLISALLVLSGCTPQQGQQANPTNDSSANMPAKSTAETLLQVVQSWQQGQKDLAAQISKLNQAGQNPGPVIIEQTGIDPNTVVTLINLAKQPIDPALKKESETLIDTVQKNPAGSAVIIAAALQNIFLAYRKIKANT